MLITKEHQEAMINNYIKAGHTADECIGFIDGIEQAFNFVAKLDRKERGV